MPKEYCSKFNDRAHKKRVEITKQDLKIIKCRVSRYLTKEEKSRVERGDALLFFLYGVDDDAYKYINRACSPGQSPFRNFSQTTKNNVVVQNITYAALEYRGTTKKTIGLEEKDARCIAKYLATKHNLLDR